VDSRRPGRAAHDVGGRQPKSSPPEPTAPARLGGVALALITSALVLSMYVVHSQMPDNAVTLPYEASIRQPVRHLLPQGWAFFTRDPREADLLPFTRDENGQWQAALLGPHSEFRNVLGFARASRAQGVEMGNLAGGLVENDWQDCRGPVAPCLEAAAVVTVENSAPAPSLCGDVGFVSRPPVPWAWSHSQQNLTMPGTVARLEVSC
jgi:antimicrobial peptide system SdpA family protein